MYVHTRGIPLTHVHMQLELSCFAGQASQARLQLAARFHASAFGDNVPEHLLGNLAESITTYFTCTFQLLLAPFLLQANNSTSSVRQNTFSLLFYGLIHLNRNFTTISTIYPQCRTFKISSKSPGTSSRTARNS